MNTFRLCRARGTNWKPGSMRDASIGLACQADHPLPNRVQTPPRRLGSDGGAFVNQLPVDVLQPHRDPQDVGCLLARAPIGRRGPVAPIAQMARTRVRSGQSSRSGFDNQERLEQVGGESGQNGQRGDAVALRSLDLAGRARYSAGLLGFGICMTFSPTRTNRGNWESLSGREEVLRGRCRRRDSCERAPFLSSTAWIIVATGLDAAKMKFDVAGHKPCDSAAASQRVVRQIGHENFGAAALSNSGSAATTTLSSMPGRARQSISDPTRMLPK